MHELSIAMSIVDLALAEAEKANASVINQVDVEIGSMAGVELEALQFAWDSAIKNTAASKAKLLIHPIKAEAHCYQCDKDFLLENFFTQCPNCNGFRYNIIKGKELRVSSLLVD
jgi:hydrogenase nickel incorporation protein HypA/HybF